MQKHETTMPNWEKAIQEKHEMQMNTHQNQFGPLGHLMVEPSQEQLDADFEDRRAKGELFTQKMEK